jgi:hypothetical protein
MWNYRIVCIKEGGEAYCQVQEVYYDSKRRPYAYCDISIAGETSEDCIKDVAWIMVGITKPVLGYPEDFNGKAPGGRKKNTKSKGD